MAVVPPAAVAAALTVPTLLHLLDRFWTVLSPEKQRRALLHHLSRGSAAPAVHVVAGLLLLIAAPYLAWLCVPPSSSPPIGGDPYAGGWDAPARTRRVPLAVASALLVWANLSAVSLLPHPLDRHREYRAPRRAVVRAAAMIATNAAQFAAMALGVLAALCRDDGTAAGMHLGVALVYAATLAICWQEMLRRPWEDTRWGRWVWARKGPGPRAKSTLVTNVIANPDDGPAVFVVLFSMGTYAAFQSACQCRARVMGLPGPDPRLVEFYAIYMCYVASVMSATFFTFVQLDPGRATRADYAREVALGIALPALATDLGRWWIAEGAGEGDPPFVWQWTFWTREAPW